MLDKGIPYKSVWMVRTADEALLPVPTRADGFFCRFYVPGDERNWAKIEKSVGEFDSERSALAYFEREFAPYPQRLQTRMCFVCTPEGNPVATASAWEKNGRNLLHWVACMPQYQRRGLGRCAVIQALHCFPNADSIFLHTQTWSHDAILLYHSLGFCLIEEESAQNQYAEAMEILRDVYSVQAYEELKRKVKKGWK